jgi:hypothetical protein
MTEANRMMEARFAELLTDVPYSDKRKKLGARKFQLSLSFSIIGPF